MIKLYETNQRDHSLLNPRITAQLGKVKKKKQ